MQHIYPENSFGADLTSTIVDAPAAAMAPKGAGASEKLKLGLCIPKTVHVYYQYGIRSLCML